MKKKGMILVAFAILIVVIGICISNYNGLKSQMDAKNKELEVVKAALNKEMDKNKKEEYETTPVITSATLQEQLSGLSELVTQEYTYRNADCRESSETWMFGWTRPFSSKSILIVYDGTIKAGIDFSKIQINVDEKTRTITVNIPNGIITDNYIPQDSIEVLDVKDGLFNKVTFDNYNEFVSEQKNVMEQKAIEQGLLERSREQAEKLIDNFLSVIPGIDSYHVYIE